MIDVIEKAKSGIYKNTPENRKLGRVGQRYGGKEQTAEEFRDAQIRIHSQYKDFITSLANKYDGVALVAPPKSLQRLLEKLNLDYGGYFTKAKDILRSTIVVDRDRLDDLVGNFINDFAYTQKENYLVKALIDFESETYQGANFVMEFKGYAVEVQVNTPVNIALKDNDVFLRSHPALTNTYGMLESEGIKPGMGHKYYEKLRSPESTEQEKIEADQIQKEYYKNRFKFLNRDKIDMLKKSWIDKIRDVFQHQSITMPIDESGQELSDIDISRRKLYILKSNIETILVNRDEIQEDHSLAKSELLDIAKVNIAVQTRLPKQIEALEDTLFNQLRDNTQELTKAHQNLKKALGDHVDLLRQGDFIYKKYLPTSLGRTRDTMPQIDSDKIDDIILHFQGKSPDSKVTKEKFTIDKLKFVQGEINEDKVLKLIHELDIKKLTPFLVAKHKGQYWLIDGHHRLCVIAELDQEAEIQAYVIHLDPKEAIRRLNLMKVTRNDDITKSFDPIEESNGEETQDLNPFEVYPDDYEELLSKSFSTICKAFNEDQITVDQYYEAKKAYDEQLEKAVYKNNPQNQKLGRVGQHYGSSIEIDSKKDYDIEHSVYGKGKVLNKKGLLLDVDFGKDIGIKKILSVDKKVKVINSKLKEGSNNKPKPNLIKLNIPKNISEAKEFANNLFSKINGVKFSFSGYSDTNGQSIYYNASYGGKEVKVRISDHSVSNVNRVLNEVHFNFDQNNEQNNKAIEELKDRLGVNNDKKDEVQKAFDTITFAFDQDLIPLEKYIEAKNGFEKARTGVYADNVQNRQLKRVGQKYGEGKKQDEQSNGKQGSKSDFKQPKTYSDTELANHAKNASEEGLNRQIKTNKDPKIREAAHKELDRRSKKEAVQEKGGNKEVVDEQKKKPSLLDRYRAKQEAGLIKDNPKINTIESILDKIKSGKISDEELKNTKFWKDTMPEIRDNNLIGEGSESKVYNYGNNNVIKVKDASQYKNLSELMDSISVHNEIFPETHQKIIGFTNNESGGVSVILKQNKIKGLKNATKDLIIKDMKQRGFEFQRNDTYSNGIIEVSDIFPSDVYVDKDGDLYYIDAIIKDKKQSNEGSLDLLQKKLKELREADIDYSDNEALDKNIQDIKEVSDKIKEAKEKEQSELAKSKGISEEEKQSLYNYTGTDYRKINDSLRKGKADEGVQKMESQINSALDKLKSFSGIVHRVESAYDDLDKIAEYYNGADTIEFPAFTSTTQDKSVIDGFDGDVFFEIKSKNGKNISDFSEISSEKEVLFKSKSQFNVKSVKMNKLKNGMVIGLKIKLEEV